MADIPPDNGEPSPNLNLRWLLPHRQRISANLHPRPWMPVLFFGLIPGETQGLLRRYDADSDSGGLEALMQAAQAGDMRAYERLLREIAPRLRQMVRRRR